MATKITHRAKILALDLAISVMHQTRQNFLLRTIFRQAYTLFRDGRLIIWGGAILASAVGGFLVGYLSYFLFPR